MCFDIYNVEKQFLHPIKKNLNNSLVVNLIIPKIVEEIESRALAAINPQ